jgi:hypothetical protein
MDNHKAIRSLEEVKPQIRELKVRELGEAELDLVIGGHIGPGPIMLNPQPLPP